MKTEQEKKDINMKYANYLKLNEDAKQWIYNKIDKNEIFSIKGQYESFVKNYEDRKKDVSNKYNVNKYLNFMTSFFLLCLIILDFFINLFKVTIKNLKYFLKNPVYFIYTCKCFIKSTTSNFFKFIQLYKHLILKTFLFLLKEKKKIAKEIKDLFSFCFKVLYFYVYKYIQSLYQYLYIKYCELFKPTKNFKVAFT
ncbi:hypothetical protein PFAG_02320 [Plasmodium falciparum Santa Lucia]|uniref:Uncharacterized protein n=13 Tax=Plasmodium falciparum TaxID=5833 RepID=Q8I367_PLAF7|nr:conserved Plasmodium protein, unknown function [Plasmodium falciparum 3D7]ETW18472.1 hypothetical protein PFFVO_02372 [Plasmodium falciparum Vietnam Oak-Knoll (FVO)]ETW36858.1 hypothetical protein PFTANZ_02441 [Plasmodium falciparum Tanzania (2000708)]ETW43017.1 hypothetical protein PFNF135_02492 [Plasmodium falciparum NF135/5.C10]ETW49660.1 hypothetical protein PFMALIP_02368 [Plasmodium falciparum MaliPS096_E11]ETW55018.1 hypothetical protein PFUGPA_02841 [Plasmodium falciparum Palo Alto/U|eukprot:XP_001351956.2 conserved Plasmodium protein, unknown function [Plasmodium falciparum 3D7]